MRLIFLSSILLLTLFSCKKEQGKTWDDLPYYPMDAEFQSYFAPAREGSYWIYHDSAKNTYDTVEIESFSTVGGQIYSDDPLEGYRADGFMITYSSSIGIRYNIKIDVMRSGDDYDMRLHYYDRGFGGDVEKIDGQYTNCNILDSVLINGQTYYDVLEITDGIAYNPVWFAKDIGIIYKSSSFTGQLELIDYHIVPNN